MEAELTIFITEDTFQPLAGMPTEIKEYIIREILSSLKMDAIEGHSGISE